MEGQCTIFCLSKAEQLPSKPVPHAALQHIVAVLAPGCTAEQAAS
jgi:hypothetical protein